MEDCLPWEGPHAGAEEPEEKGAAETMCDELTAAPIPHCLAPLGEDVEKIRRKLEPRKKGGVRGRCFKIWFYFSLSFSSVIGNNLN